MVGFAHGKREMEMKRIIVFQQGDDAWVHVGCRPHLNLWTSITAIAKLRREEVKFLG